MPSFLRADVWIIAAHATGIALDVVYAFDGAPETATISDRLKYVAARVPLWPYSLTMLAGHFALQPPYEGWTLSQPTGIILLAIVGALWFAAGTWLRGGTLTTEEIFWTNVIAINTGWLSGMVLWSQSPLDSIPNLF